MSLQLSLPYQYQLYRKKIVNVATATYQSMGTVSISGHFVSFSSTACLHSTRPLQRTPPLQHRSPTWCLRRTIQVFMPWFTYVQYMLKEKDPMFLLENPWNTDSATSQNGAVIQSRTGVALETSEMRSSSFQLHLPHLCVFLPFMTSHLTHFGWYKASQIWTPDSHA